MSIEIWLSLAIAFGFSAVHIFGRHLTFLSVTPRSVWLSTAGGISTVYVFVHLLPELAEYQETFNRRLEPAGSFLRSIESHVWVLAFIGLAVFYGLDRLVGKSARGEALAGRDKRASSGVFWTHLGSFAIYNVLISYMLLHRQESGIRGLLIYAIALGLHFLVNDHSLRDNHGRVYDQFGRWILAVMPPIGWILGVVTEVSVLLIAGIFAFLSGGIVLNVLKEELPEERESRWWAFALGASGYGALLLATR